MAFCIATSCATAPSVSLEGKNLWVLRTMPISGKTVLLGKLLMVCRLQMPLVVSEAVHLSQAYAYPEVTAFINGVLGAYARSKPAAKEDTADGTNSGDSKS